MVDVVLRGGEVIDGTGAPRRRSDVALRGGRIKRMAPDIAPDGARVIDAGGMVITPGFVDLHTHYDAQVLWDPNDSPSSLHGVTTVIGGNCGFTIAPMAPEHADYVRRMMATVEGMPLSALAERAAWDWTSFGRGSALLDGRLAVNAGFLAGHSTIRRLVMGEEAVSAKASPAQMEAMVALLDESLAEGALGFSSSNGPHLDGKGDPVPSRASDHDELVALAAVVRRHEGTTLEFIPGIGEIGPEGAALMADMSLAGGRPLNWNLLGNLSPTPIYAQQLTASDVAAERGAVVVALTLPDIMKMRSDQMLESLPGWKDFFDRPPAERQKMAADPDVRAALLESAGALSARGLGAAEAWDLIEIGPADDGTTTAAVGRTVAEVAAERGVEPLDVVIDDVAGEGLHLTLLFPSLEPTLGRSDEGWAARAAVSAATPAPCSVAPTPVPTSTSCATPTTPRSCSARRCGTGGCSPWRRQSTSSPRCRPSSTACAAGARCPRAAKPTWWSSTPTKSARVLPSCAATCPAVAAGSTPRRTGSSTCW